MIPAKKSSPPGRSANRTKSTIPFLDEKTTVGLLPHLQARLLARHLRGDLDAYPAFLAR